MTQEQDRPMIDDLTLDLYHTYCGMNDRQELERHLMSIKKQLFAVSKYKCIQKYKFAFSRVYYRFFYNRILKYGQELVRMGQEPFLLDIGCCTGTDLRKLYIDGYPKSYLIGVDVDPAYIQCGFQLFKDMDTCPIKFIVADLFTDELCEYTKKIFVAHAGSIFHLFTSMEMNQEFVRRIKRLIKPGGILAGGHVISNRSGMYYRPSDKTFKFYISIEDFKAILEFEGFKEIEFELTEKADDERVNMDGIESTLYWISFMAILQ
ncbi:hypothetical protein G6F70_001384 [Rhizopus microsporus]|uniref:Methyltransferase domain-containing protein n=1 Tax=Rhizopus microsporus TaxID=58291 RepID=A0A1X0S0T2_RHIZD|nr:hypothetical protein G6F71_002407 [Rhizopus microsporus]KAG1203442.1 hypothetical protein G6F70_001384 [Rhizopus microsporus]KAG1215043.1 hypothetical protein G6F69_001378 [Rhizopus microsporus]KAG1236609.1 hypothetical protein G6F67_001849 [Rhizopus microsporus]KAG1268353.1 hypothetical protein G6F68_001186 [Rhizopus microsporus]